MKPGGLSLLEASALGLRTLAALSRRRSGSDFCLLPSSFCLLPSHSAVGGGARQPRRTGKGGERGRQIRAGIGKVRVESQRFLELPDRFTGAASLAQGNSQVVMGVGLIRFQAESLLEFADRGVNLAFAHKGGAEVVVGAGVIRFEAEGFLEFAYFPVVLAFFE